MKKISKRLTAIILCLFIITGTLVTDNINAKAAAIPVATGVSSLFKAIVGSGIAYSGYKATKKQLSEISGTVSTLVKDYAVVAKKATATELADDDTYNAWLAYQWMNHPYKSALKTFAHGIYVCAAEKMEKRKEEIRLELIEGGKKDPDNEPETPDIDKAVNTALMAWLCDRYNKNIDALSDLAEGRNVNTDNDLINNGIGAQAGIQVALSLGFNKAISGLAAEVIKKDYNSEYEKAKGKYDWEKLGFISDYDTLEISKSSTEQFADYDRRQNGFNHNNTLIKTMLSGNFYSLLSVPCGVEKTALVTIRNPNTGLWKTVFLTEEQLYYFVASVKNGSYTFSDIDSIITKNYYAKDNTVPSFPLKSFNINTTNNGSWLANDCFFESFAKGEYYTNPLTVTYRPSADKLPMTNGEFDPMYLQKTNTTIYNVGKTLNVYFWNFADETKYIGSTTALNGLEDIKPAVKNSIYTNTADEIDKHPNINIDTNKDYDNTDEQINDIAQDNDLNLEVIENNTEDITDNTKGILETVKGILSSITSLPRKIYNFFNGILNKILNAIKANPLNFFNYIADPLTAVETAIKKGIKEIIENMPSSVANVMPDYLKNILDKIDLNLSTAATNLIDIAGNGYNLGQINNMFNLIESIAGDTVLGDIVDAITNSPAGNILRAIENLPNSLSLGNIVTAINNLPVGNILRAIENLPNTLSMGNIATAISSLPSSIADSAKAVFNDLFIPDTAVINNAIKDLKSNFSFVGDFKGIVDTLISTPIEPHDYVTIYNWNKENNKYDNRDSYRIYFTWYSPYRPYVNAIIIAFAYLFFIWRVFIKLPSIISGTGGGIETIYTAQTYSDLKNGG